MKKLGLLLLVLTMSVCSFFVFAACGSKNEVTIRFEMNGGEQIKSVKTTKGEEYILPEDAVREGFTFEGWYLDDKFTGEAVTKVAPDKNITVYAKWSEIYTLKLEANGGSLSSTEFQFKEGDDFAALLKDVEITPPANHIFGGWFNGSNEFGGTLPASDLTLTARYKVKYVVQAYVENADGSSYDRDRDLDIEDYDYAGVTPNVEKAGYTLDASHNDYNVGALNDDATKNVFKAYYKGQATTLTLWTVYPTGGDVEDETIEVKFGQKIELPEPECEGYVLAGWSTRLNATEAKYPSSYIYNRLHNRDKATAPEQYKVDGYDVELYTVWIKGVSDVFGGNDLIYHLNADDRNIYLYRSGFYFVGRFKESTNTFTFTTGNGSTIEGKLLDDGTFCYANAAKADTDYRLYGDPTIGLHMDAYNGVRYVEYDPDTGLEKGSSSGTYVLDESSEETLYVVTFDYEGPMSGRTLTIRLDNENKYFYIRNDEELGYGRIYRFVGEYRYYTSAYYMEFTGYGTIRYNNGSNISIYRSRKDDTYSGEGEYYILENSAGLVAGKIWIVEKSNFYGYYLIEDVQEYKTEDGTASLTLDGIYTAQFKDANGDTFVGEYSFGNTYLDDSELIVVTKYLGDPSDANFSQNVSRRYFMIKAHTVVDGETTTVTYTLEVKQDTYRECLYMNDAGQGYKLPLLAFDEDEVGKVSIYGWNDQSKYVKIASADYDVDEDTGYITVRNIKTTPEYEGSSYVWEEETDLAVELDQVESFVMGTVVNSAGNIFYYINSMKVRDVAEKTYSKVYTNDNGDKLEIISVFAYYTSKDSDGVSRTVFGSYARYTGEDNIIILSVQNAQLIFELNEAERKFTLLEDFLGVIYGMTEDGEIVRTLSLTFDGRGGVIYTDGETEISGTYGEDEENNCLVLTSNDEQTTIKFRLYTSNGTYFFVIYNEELAGVYTDKNDGKSTLTLDGFVQAVYKDAEGQEHTSVYLYNREENSISISLNDVVRYFDLKENKTYTLRGEEYNEFVLWYANQVVRNMYFTLDGYGNLGVYDLNDNSLGSGTYELVSENHYKFTYTLTSRPEKEETVFGLFGYVNMGGTTFRALLVEHGEMTGSYINTDDWTVMTLDSIGNLSVKSNYGISEVGSFRIINSGAIFCMFGNVNRLYLVDTDRGTVTPVRYSPYGYYTENFEALNFSEYGGVYLEGELAFYMVDDEGKVTIYREANENEIQNEYGFFVIEDFGTFDDETKEYNRKTYYRASGFSLTFERDATTKNDYPIGIMIDGESVKKPLETLSFTPINNGDKSGEFAVRGSVMINGRNYYCDVIREINDDESVEFYLMLLTAGGGYFRFDLELSYKGEQTESLYSISSMKTVAEYESYTYYTIWAYLTISYGQTFANNVKNTLGTVSIIREFDKQGNPGDPTLSAQFGALNLVGVDSGVRYYNGEYVKLDSVQYTQTPDGVYTVEIHGTDDHDYVLRFVIQQHSMVGVPCFAILAFTRKEVLTTDDGNFKVEIERVISSEYSTYQAGSYYNVMLSKKTDGDMYEIVPNDIGFIKDGVINYVSYTRDKDSEKITEAAYYYITLTEHIDSEVDDSEDTEEDPLPSEEEKYVPLKLFDKAEVVAKTLQVLYSEDGNYWVDFSEEDDKVVAIIINGTYYIVVDCTYDAETQTYNVITTTNRKFSVKITGNNVTVTA